MLTLGQKLDTFRRRVYTVNMSDKPTTPLHQRHDWRILGGRIRCQRCKAWSGPEAPWECPGQRPMPSDAPQAGKFLERILRLAQEGLGLAPRGKPRDNSDGEP